ncbi:MAG TPA: MraY family glycosyltransferase, partial [Dermatophilaceae bacterium]
MREYLLVFIVAAAMTYAATPFVRWLALATGAITEVRDRDVHAVPIPRLGGVAILIGFVAALLVATRLPFLSQIFQGGEMKGVLIGAVIVCAVGALDDIRQLDWLTKLAGQMLAAGVMAFQGVQLLSLPLFGVTVLPTPVLVSLTILIVVISANAVNFIDGLDGLAAGVVGIAGLAFFAYSYLLSRTYDPPNVFSSASFITAALVGCCVGFLPHNFHPARLFMGDAGALLLGLLLAAATISMTGSIDPNAQVSGNAAVAILLPVVLPLAILSLPLLDVLLAVVRRTRAGRRPWHPDAEHLHHRMLQIGHTHVRAVLLLYLWAA